jgi:membrane-associated phospholipid phosphatase
MTARRNSKSQPALSLSRRFFLRVGSLSAVALVTRQGGARTEPSPAARRSERADRLNRAFKRRMEAAEHARSLGSPEHRASGDEARHGNWACYSKALPHAENGEPVPAAYQALREALANEHHDAFEAIPLGGYVKLSNPQAAFAFDLAGPDAHQLTIPSAPSFSSAEQAAEMVELYWQALLRDIPFAEYDTHPLAREAADELSRLSGFEGPRISGRVTPATLFRGDSVGGRTGPYVSQFLLRDLPWIPIRVPQRIRTLVPEKDYLTDPAEWLAIQNGAVSGPNLYDGTARYIRTGRDLAEYVHRDFTYQLFLGACLMLFRMNAPVDGGVPYHHSLTQSGFVTFGASDIVHLVAAVANLALKACWYQKWLVHRRLRPEEFGGRLHFQATAGRAYPFHVDVLNSTAMSRSARKYGTRLLPHAYPEGSPTHPAYPSGHAVIAGACVTVLKACFAESFVIPDPVIPTVDGLGTVPYKQRELTIGNELDKLAENAAFGRNFGGIHWRTDATAGLALGENYAIHFLREMKLASSEVFDGFSLTKFDGTRVVIR